MRTGPIITIKDACIKSANFLEVSVSSLRLNASDHTDVSANTFIVPDISLSYSHNPRRS